MIRIWSRKPDPVPYLWLMDPDPYPGGPKTCGSGGSRPGSAILLITRGSVCVLCFILYFFLFYYLNKHGRQVISLFRLWSILRLAVKNKNAGRGRGLEKCTERGGGDTSCQQRTAYMHSTHLYTERWLHIFKPTYIHTVQNCRNTIKSSHRPGNVLFPSIDVHMLHRMYAKNG